MKKKILLFFNLIIIISLLFYIGKKQNYFFTKKEKNLYLEEKKQSKKKKTHIISKTQKLTLKKYRRLKAGSIIKKEQLPNIKECRKFFYAANISDKIFQRIYLKSYKKNCTVLKEDLRYIKVLHIGFDKKTHIGELIVNQKIESDILAIFYELYKEKYPIEKIQLIDNYNAEDEKSMQANNTSCFNFRTIKGKSQLSKHSQGLAVDINPLYNPCIRKINKREVYQPITAINYIDREKDFPNKISEEDTCYKIFKKYGFRWGGHWKSLKDYQHFEK